MGITVSDIRRAILRGGDVSAFTEVYHQALGGPPVPSLSSLDTPVALPQPMVLLEHIDRELATAIDVWGRSKDCQPPPAKVDLTLIALAPYGQNIGKYLEHVIDEVKPDIMVVDSSPLELSASMLYAFSLRCAVGLPAYGQIIAGDSGQFYSGETFYPGSMNETAIIKSWLGRIPLLPVGSPQKPTQPDPGSGHSYVDETYAEWVAWQSSLLTAYHTLDESLNGVTALPTGIKMAKDICLSLMKIPGSQMREDIIKEACYIASRIIEVAAYTDAKGRRARLLAVVDIAHYSDVEYIADLLERGITDEIYVPQKGYARAKEMVLVGKNRDNLSEEAKEHAPKSTLAQELFHNKLDSLIEAREVEVLPEAEAHRLIAEITGRTRVHPAIARGASVRGTIALEEVLRGFVEMCGSLTRQSISKAALITLPPRISLKQKGNEVAIVNDIVKEVLYSIRFSNEGKETAASKAWQGLSAGDALDSLSRLGQIAPAPNRELTQKNLPAIVAETSKREALKHLEAMNFLRQEQPDRYSLTREALEYLISELEHKLRAGEITPDEYNQQKARLAEMLRNISESGFEMSARELATTIMEIMDAQDKQWSNGVSFDTMHVYYHVRENSEGAELTPQKRDYYALKRLISDLRKQGILKAAEKAPSFILTGTALSTLLIYLIDKNGMGQELQKAIDFGRALAEERNHEIRRYSSGDVFRDISVRHTLREIARQKKGLADVRSSDFRVFLKQHRKPRSDIVLCLDTSGSMGFQHKLIYARLAAAGLVHAATQNRDRVGMVAFSDRGQVNIPPTEKDKDFLIDCIAGLSARGNTNIGDGIKCSTELLCQSRSNNQKYIILITDGQPTAISERTFAQLGAVKERDLTEESAILETKQAAARGIRVSIIHIASAGEASTAFIRNIARIGRGKIRRMSRPDDLKAVLP